MKERRPATHHTLQQSGDVFLDIPMLPADLQPGRWIDRTLRRKIESTTDKFSVNGALQLD